MNEELLFATRGIQPLIDTISRTAAITNTVPANTVNLLRSNQLTDWELTIRETTGITDIDLTLTISQQSSSYVIKQPLNRGGGWQYQGFGAVQIDAIAVNAGTGSLELSIKPITSKIPYIMVAGQSTRQTLAVAGNWYPLDNLSNATPSGYAPPFTKFVAAKPSGNTALRFVDGTGVAIWQSPVLTAVDNFWDEIRIYPWFALEVQPAVNGQFITTLWYN